MDKQALRKRRKGTQGRRGRRVLPRCRVLRLLPIIENNTTFVLAHNGHDALWARLGKRAAEGVMTDSEAIARAWAALGLSPASLCDLHGAFVGFQAGHPFVAKDRWSDLIGATGEEGAILFASQLPTWLEREFAAQVRLGEYSWTGGALALHHFAAEPSRQPETGFPPAGFVESEDGLEGRGPSSEMG